MTKPPLILLHGALGSSRYFAKLKVNLASDFEVYILDFDGHGDKVSDKTFSIDLFADNLIDFLKSKGLKKSAIFGYSMGGYVALTAALKEPELIGDIITLGTKFNWSPEIAAKEVAMLNPEKIEIKVPKFAANLKALHDPTDWKVMMKKTADLMIGLGDGAGLEITDFQQINHNVVIGIGTADKMVSIDESIERSNLLPNGSIEILDDVPHPIEMVNLEVLTAYVFKFL